MTELRFPVPALPPGTSNLVLTGFSGTGKSSAGRLAADLLGMPFFDLDEIAERRQGRPLAEVFLSGAEAGFRELEAELLGAAARLSGAVIATGAGAIRHSQFWSLAQPAVTLTLTAPVDEIARRLGDAKERPLLSPDPPRLIARLLAERESAYSNAGPPLPTCGGCRAPGAAEIAAAYRGQARPAALEVSGPQGAYPVLVGEGALDRLADFLLSHRSREARVVVAFDPAVPAAAEVARTLEEAGREAWAVAVPSGEAAKRIEVVMRLWDRFQLIGLDRGDVVVAIGGGAVLDAVGFACATWGRGIPWVTVPTTLLAMVDASLGGKVAIDHPDAKNAIGAFHHPLGVICDLSRLAGLLPSVARDGLAEVVKCGALASPLLLDRLLLDGAGADSSPAKVGWLIEQAARIKAAYVAADPEDRGPRQSLNLGHTYAHALEVASGYRISHGRAVAVGLVAAAGLGLQLGLTPPGLGDTLEAILIAEGLLGQLPRLDPQLVRGALRTDKKRRGGEAAFIVPVGDGVALLHGLELEAALSPLWPRLAGPGPGGGGSTPRQALPATVVR